MPIATVYADQGDTIPGLPSFVRSRPNAEMPRGDDPAQLLALFDWWAPVVTGNPARDYGAGERYFADALALGLEAGSPSLILNAITGMAKREPGAVEVGFLAALAQKAMVGSEPPAISEGIISLLAQAYTREEIRGGEQTGRRILETARAAGDFRPIALAMLSIATGRMGQGAIGCAWAICSAAIQGGRN